MPSSPVLDADSTCRERIPIETQERSRIGNGQEQPDAPPTSIDESGRAGPHEQGNCRQLESVGIYGKESHPARDETNGSRKPARSRRSDSRHRPPSRAVAVRIFLLLSTTAELFIVDVVAQHDPQPDSELAGHRSLVWQSPSARACDDRSASTRILACRMSRRFSPQETQHRAALLGQSAEALSLAAGVLARNDPDVAGYRLAIREALRIAQEYIRGQCRHRPYSRMGPRLSCPRNAAPLAR